MLEPSLNYVNENKERFTRQLQEYLRIPSISTLPNYKFDIQRTAEWLTREFTRIGLTNVHIYETENNPFVFGEWMESPSAPTLLVYGHYDVQPVDPLEAWSVEPFSAEIKNGKIFARGASDNKGQHFAHLKAIEAYLSTSGKLPINIKVLIEGEEEIGSPNIEAFVTAHQRLLTSDSGIISDGAMLKSDQPSINYGLRGMVAMELHVQGPSRDLHSGSYGGTVYNPVQALADILAKLLDQTGSVNIPGFYKRVRPITSEEHELLENAPFGLEQWRENTGTDKPWGESQFSLLERIGARPSLDINGIWGGFQGEGTKTIIPSNAGAKVSMRLVPDQIPGEIAQLFTNHIHTIAPSHVDVDVYTQAMCSPALMPLESQEMTSAFQAVMDTWGIKPVFTRGGGSLPVVAAFQRIIGTPFILLPIGLDDNRHSPDEHFHLSYFFRGIETAIRYYHYLSS